MAGCSSRASRPTSSPRPAARSGKKTIDHAELEQYQSDHEVISTRLFAGKTIVHVLSDTQPAGFEPVEGGLEDVYFSTLSTLRRAA